MVYCGKRGGGREEEREEVMHLAWMSALKPGISMEANILEKAFWSLKVNHKALLTFGAR